MMMLSLPFLAVDDVVVAGSAGDALLLFLADNDVFVAVFSC